VTTYTATDRIVAAVKAAERKVKLDIADFMKIIKQLNAPLVVMSQSGLLRKKYVVTGESQVKKILCRAIGSPTGLIGAVGGTGGRRRMRFPKISFFDRIL
jgi:hypothetical protein